MRFWSRGELCFLGASALGAVGWERVSEVVVDRLASNPLFQIHSTHYNPTPTPTRAQAGHRGDPRRRRLPPDRLLAALPGPRAPDSARGPLHPRPAGLGHVHQHHRAQAGAPRCVCTRGLPHAAGRPRAGHRPRALRAAVPQAPVRAAARAAAAGGRARGGHASGRAAVLGRPARDWRGRG